jgi:Sister chromatid cohesion protein Dcc1
MIKGGSVDDAVQFTSDKTYNIRSVTLSNSVLLVSPSPQIDGSESQVVIQDRLNELLGLVSAVPKPYRMNILLKKHEWKEGHEDDEEEEEEKEGEGGSFRAVSTGTDKTYTPQRRHLERDYFSRRSTNGLLLKMPRQNFRPASRR